MQTDAAPAQTESHQSAAPSVPAIDRKTKYNPIPLDVKAAILEASKPRIMDGETFEQIAESHGITSRTLKQWFLDMGDEYRQLRQAAIDQSLIDAQEAIDNAGKPTINPVTGEEEPIDIALAQFHLARAREQFKARAWIAERRDKRYAAQQGVTAQPFSGGITINIGNVQAPGALIDGAVVDGEASKY